MSEGLSESLIPDRVGAHVGVVQHEDVVGVNAAADQKGIGRGVAVAVQLHRRLGLVRLLFVIVDGGGQKRVQPVGNILIDIHGRIGVKVIVDLVGVEVRRQLQV